MSNSLKGIRLKVLRFIKRKMLFYHLIKLFS